jgi:AcrR family transcriptional regulator
MDAGGEEYVLEAVMGGTSTADVSRICDVSRGMLYEWLHKDETRWQRYQEAREIGAHAMADEALDIVDRATNDTITVDRERAKVRQWLAERANKKDFGKDRGDVNLNLSIGDLHLDALQAAQKALPMGEGQVVDAEFEVVDEPTLDELL